MSESVTAVLFDVDGTLVDSNYLHAVTWWGAFSQGGYDVAMADIGRAIRSISSSRAGLSLMVCQKLPWKGAGDTR